MYSTDADINRKKVKLVGRFEKHQDGPNLIGMFRKSSLIGLIAFGVALAVPESAEALFGGYTRGTNCYLHRYGALAAIPAQVVNVCVFFIAAYWLGRLVCERNWPVGYTRKILAVTLYAAPFVTGLWFPTGLTVEMITLSAMVYGLCVLALSGRYRASSKFLTTAFAAIDRPEDRPHTIPWLLTSILATWFVLVVWSAVLPYGAGLAFLFVALFISGIGDALAEPVGLRYGRNTYTVRALFTDKTYTRSWEGSACVFASGVIAVVLLSQIGSLDVERFILYLIAFPIVATAAEAKSPHTWDQPFIIGACGLAGLVVSWLLGGAIPTIGLPPSLFGC